MATAPASSDGQRLRVAALLAFVLAALLYANGLMLTVFAGEPLWPSVAIVPLFGFPVVGLLVVLRRPDNVMAWLCLAIGLLWGVIASIDGALVHERAFPGSVPRPDVLVALSALWVVGLFLFGTFLLLYPDGRLPSRGWRAPVGVAAFATGLLYVSFVVEPGSLAEFGFPQYDNPLGIEAAAALMPLTWTLVVLLPTYILASVVALLLRFHRSSGIERLQLKWLVACGGVVAPAFLGVIAVLAVLDSSGRTEPVLNDVVGPLLVMLFGLVPIAVGVALLRYRLFEIDRLISRTVTYGLVVAVLVGVWAGGLLVVGSLLPRQSDLGVAASTLAVAALFNRLRRRVQRGVERRFNRSRYDAERELERFAGRLRDELDLDGLTDDLLGVVATTVQPSSAGVWIREVR